MRIDLPDHASTDFPAAAEAYVMRLRRVYDLRATWHRRLYRFSGIVVILAGAGLPLMVTLDYGVKNLAVSFTGVLVAVVTGLRAFYRWDQSWILLRKTELSITSALWHWRSREPGTDREAATELMQRVYDIRKYEVESFFKDLAYPALNGVELPGQR